MKSCFIWEYFVVVCRCIMYNIDIFNRLLKGTQLTTSNTQTQTKLVWGIHTYRLGIEAYTYKFIWFRVSINLKNIRMRLFICINGLSFIAGNHRIPCQKKSSRVDIIYYLPTNCRHSIVASHIYNMINKTLYLSSTYK